MKTKIAHTNPILYTIETIDTSSIANSYPTDTTGKQSIQPSSWYEGFDINDNNANNISICLTTYGYNIFDKDESILYD